MNQYRLDAELLQPLVIELVYWESSLNVRPIFTHTLVYMQSPVIIHLVHGTWPYGFLRLARTSWFSDGSDFRKTISANLGEAVTFSVCNWSGKNSVAERKKASQILYSQINRAIEENPNTAHIIVAHSHGGTVAADALSYVFEPGRLSRIRALVAMATPFAYVRPVSSKAADFNGLSEAAVLTTSLALLINAFLVDLPKGFVFFVGWLFVSIIVSILVSVCSNPSIDSAYMGEPINPAIPVFLVRATRDEAALSLAMAEALNGINLLIAQHLSLRRGLVAAAMLAVCINLIFYFVFHGNPLPLPDESGNDIGVFFAAYATIPGIFLVFGKTLQAAATGLPIRLWRNYRIEVDVAPPFTDCVFRSYSDLYAPRSRSMRHGIHAIARVQNDIRYLVNRVVEGHMATLPRIELDE